MPNSAVFSYPSGEILPSKSFAKSFSEISEVKIPVEILNEDDVLFSLCRTLRLMSSSLLLSVQRDCRESPTDCNLFCNFHKSCWHVAAILNPYDCVCWLDRFSHLVKINLFPDWAVSSFFLYSMGSSSHNRPKWFCWHQAICNRWSGRTKEPSGNRRWLWRACLCGWIRRDKSRLRLLRVFGHLAFFFWISAFNVNEWKCYFWCWIVQIS